MNIEIAAGGVSFLFRLRSALALMAGWRLMEGLKPGSSGAERPADPTPVAVNGTTTLLIAALTPEEGFPDFRTRRELYRICKHVGGGHILVIVDAAEIRRVWIWERRRAEWPVEYRESLEPGGLEDLSRLLQIATDDLAQSEDRESPAPAIHTIVERAIGGTGTRRRAAGAQELLEAIADASDPAVTRRVWRALTAIRIVDLSCGDGSWLLEAAAAMESLYAACLGRMAGWVLDNEQVSRSVPGRHRGFRTLLAQVGSRSELRSNRYMIDRVILFNLHGVARHPLDALVTRSRLTRAVAATDEHLNACVPLPETELRIVMSEASAQPVSPRPRTRQAHRIGLMAEAWECESAYAIIRDLQLGGRARAGELAAAYREIGKRRESLVKRHRKGIAAGPGVAETLDELYLHFPELLERGRSEIVCRPG
jgi:hypothetical protein